MHQEAFGSRYLPRPANSVLQTSIAGVRGGMGHIRKRRDGWTRVGRGGIREGSEWKEVRGGERASTRNSKLSTVTAYHQQHS